MRDVQSGWLHIVHELQVAAKLPTKVAGNHLLLSVTGRSERCRSGSEISGAGLCERQGAERRSRGVEGCGIRDELNDGLLSIKCNSQSRWFLAGSSPTATSNYSRSKVASAILIPSFSIFRKNRSAYSITVL